MAGLQFAVLLSRRFSAADPLIHLKGLRREIDPMLDVEFAERRADPRADIFSMLVNARFESGEPIEDVEIRDPLMTLLLADHETTATGLVWTFDLLTRNPPVMNRLVAPRADHYPEPFAFRPERCRPAMPPIANGIWRLPRRSWDEGLRGGERDAGEGGVAARVDPMPGGVRVRVMENVERAVAVAHLDDERVAGLAVRDRHRDAVVRLAPQQPDMDPVIVAAVELAHRLEGVDGHGV
jgi:hypothetical protein